MRSPWELKKAPLFKSARAVNKSVFGVVRLTGFFVGLGFLAF